MPSWRAFAVALGFVLLGLVVAVDGSIGSRTAPALELAIAGFLWLIAGLVGSGRSRSPTFRAGRGAVEAREHALYIRGRCVVPRVSRCVLTKQDHQIHHVAIHDDARFPRAIVTLSNVFDAQRLIAALERPDELVTFSVGARSSAFGRLVGALGIIAIGIGGILDVMLQNGAWLLLPALGILALRLPTNAAIGRDGVVISCLGVETFLPFSATSSIERDYGVVFHLEGGRTKRIYMKPEQVDLFIGEIEKARSHANDTATTERLLSRGGQSAEAWREELRRLSQPGYRQQALERERLWEVYENPTADESARLGAAILLKAHADDADNARLVRVAAAVASPELRDQLDGLGPDSDAALGTMRR